MSRYIDIIPGETPLAKELRQVAEILEARRDVGGDDQHDSGGTGWFAGCAG